MSKQTSILLIYTGGTIGMIRDYETGSLRAFNFDALMNHIPELNQLDCKIEHCSFESPIDSSDMNPSYWAVIASIIENNYDAHDGFVVLHGSDTMSYSSSALSFMLENLAKPVIFTGSQLPIGDLRTDAKENLITSIQIAALQESGTPVIQEVCVYFEYKLYRGNRTSKVSAEQFEAFTSPNYPHLIESGVHLKVNKALLLQPKKNKKLIVHRKMGDGVGLLKLFPGMNRTFLSTILKTQNLKVLILETYGAGNAPTSKWFLEMLENAVNSGLIIVNVTQCVGGSVSMGDYVTSYHLEKMKIVDGKDITSESAIVKAMYLLGYQKSNAEFKSQFEVALRGEMG